MLSETTMSAQMWSSNFDLQSPALFHLELYSEHQFPNGTRNQQALLSLTRSIRMGTLSVLWTILKLTALSPKLQAQRKIASCLKMYFQVVFLQTLRWFWILRMYETIRSWWTISSISPFKLQMDSISTQQAAYFLSLLTPHRWNLLLIPQTTQLLATNRVSPSTSTSKAFFQSVAS